MKKSGWLIWTVLVIGVMATGVAVYLYFTKKRTPKVVNGIPTGITVDPMGNVYDANGNKIGVDNGDDSFTSNSGAVVDYNGNVLSTPKAPAPAAQPNGTTGTVAMSAPAANSAPVDSTGVTNWRDYLLSNAIVN
jgi:hypothetical protein